MPTRQENEPMKQNPSRAIHPTVFMALWAVTTFGLHYVKPINIPQVATLPLVGKVVVALGGLLLIWAQVVLRRHGTTADHAKPTSTLVIDGPFRFSRNPIYLAIILIFAGLGIIHGNAWGLVMLLPFVIAVHLKTIIPEEGYLARQFGADYTSYREAVRRWL